MKCVVFCLAVVLGVASANLAGYPCPGACPQVYKPVCGSDGVETKTFSNECVMRAHGCLKSQRFEVKYLDACAEEQAVAAAAVEAKRPARLCGACLMVYEPVCASNGKEMKTFGNKCALRVHNCQHPEEAQFVMTRSGECAEQAVAAVAALAAAVDVQRPARLCGACLMVWEPVCASNGQETKTFSNKCALRTHNCKHPNEAQFVMTRSGECAEQAVAAPAAAVEVERPARLCGACLMVWEPVCASNGQETKTFTNKCALRTHNCKHPNEAQFVMTRSGECEEQGLAKAMALSLENPVRDCGVCPLLYAPVCASNGEKMMTFSNDCSLRVYNCEHPLAAKFVMTRAEAC